MKFAIFIFVYLIGAKAALIRKKKSVNDDGFVLHHVQSNNNNNNKVQNPEDSFVLKATPSSAGSENNKNKDQFVISALPKPAKRTDQIKYVKKEGKGTFWHLTDLHYDFYYNLNNPLQSVCPSSNGAAAENPGPYGDYKCDSPLKLVNASIYAMKDINPTPDFILWTGDSTMNTNNQEKYLQIDLVFDTIKKVSEIIQEAFPNTNVYPALGNHDVSPKNQMSVGRNWLLQHVIYLWDTWMDKASTEAFQDGGFYATTNPKVPNLEIFVLNTNIWYSSNKLINTSDSDPGGQFAFLRSVLNRAVEDGTKVYIVGHIPPGYYELADNQNWLSSIYNSRYVALVKQYSHVIAGQFFAHHQTDSFRIFRDGGRSVSTAWIAPGVSPMISSLSGVGNRAKNPGIRLFEYDRVSLEPTNYLQYYLDLEKANNDGNAEWKLEYDAAVAYGLNSISNSNMDTLYKTLKEADVNCEECESNKLLQKFSLYNSVSYNKDHCDEKCQRQHTCAISKLERQSYTKCINSAASLKVNQLWLFVASSLLFLASWN